MADVAAEVGVSVQTVSRALADAPGVGEETKERVLEAARRLGYRPNRIAQALATGNPRTVGVLIENPHLFGPATELHGILEAAQAEGVAVVVESVTAQNVDQRREAINSLVSQGAGGVILTGPQSITPRLFEGLDDSFPIIVLGASARRVGVVRVDVAQHLSGLINWLMDHGHRHFALLTGPRREWAARSTRTQVLAAMTAAGLPEPLLMHGDWGIESGALAAEEVMRAANVTAVISSNDEMALGLMGALQARGVRIPDDISVAGLDDHPVSAWIHPSLTTISIDHVAIGQLAFSLLRRQIADRAFTAPRITVYPGRLIMRQSTAPARVVAHGEGLSRRTP